MLLLLLFGFLAGVATTLSPCILPVLPIILSGAVGGKRRPYGIIVGFILSFAVFTLFITAIVQALHINVEILRYFGAAILGVLGIVMLVPKLQAWLDTQTGKLSGGKLTQVGQNKGGFGGGFLTGSTLGLIWTPCAGPILAAVITLAATQQAGAGAFFITLSYALGSSVIMFLIVLGSRAAVEKMKSLREKLGTIHKVFGVVILLTGVGIGFGLDRSIQAWLLEKTPQSYYEALQRFEETESIQEELQQLGQ